MPCVIFCSPTEGFSLSFLVFVLPLPSGSCISCTVARPTNPSPRPQCQLSMTWCPRPFLAHAVLTSSRRAFLFNLMRGLTDLVDRSKIISITYVSFIYQANALGAFQPALPSSKAPAPKPDNGKEHFQSELAREVPSFSSPIPTRPHPLYY